MAIVFEINVVCSRLVDLDCLFHKTDICSLGVEIEKISSMDNWLWENRITNTNMTAIQEELNVGKIIDIEFKSNVPNSSGVFIEMHNSMYVYCFWVNIDIEHLALLRGISNTYRRFIVCLRPTKNCRISDFYC